MKTPIDQNVKSVLSLCQEKSYPSLDKETRTAIPTEEAAYHLIRKSQTLRAWACLEKGPIRPIRINGRLAWKVSDIKSLLAGGS